jgi:nitrilase
MNEIVRAKVDFDVVGHYARPDVFQLSVNEEPNLPVAYPTSEISLSDETVD